MPLSQQCCDSCPLYIFGHIQDLSNHWGDDTNYVELFIYDIELLYALFHFIFFIQKLILRILFFAVVILSCSSSLGQLQPLFAEADDPEIATATSNFIYRLSRNEYFNRSFLRKFIAFFSCRHYFG